MNLNYEFANGWKVIKEMNNMENAFEYSKEYIVLRYTINNDDIHASVLRIM